MADHPAAPGQGFGRRQTFRPVGMRPAFLVLSLLVALAACERTVSIEEAKRITAEFEGKGFVPPPRTIKDITAILDQQTIADPEEAARQVAKADAKPPPAGNNKVLARFYYARGKAANVVGRQQQSLEE